MTNGELCHLFFFSIVQYNILNIHITNHSRPIPRYIYDDLKRYISKKRKKTIHCCDLYSVRFERFYYIISMCELGTSRLS